MTEFWTTHYVDPGTVATTARTMEARGWDGIAFTDSQHMAGEVFTALGVAAAATERIGLGTAVTNLSTRRVAVVASGAATVQAESAGRFTLGVGRGDSAVANLGLAAPAPERFEALLADLTAYLRGDEVVVDGVSRPLAWLQGRGDDPVPVDVAATGPRTVAAGARRADRVSFAVGADPDRLRAGMDAARRAAEAFGRAPGALRFGAYLTVAAHDEPTVARRAVAGAVATQAHFSGMDASTAATLAPEDRAVVEALTRDYDLAGHGHAAARHLDHLTDDFVGRFAIVGRPPECLDRLGALLDAVPLDRLYLAIRSRGVDPALLDDVAAVTAAEVIAPLRAARSAHSVIW